jgi:hypothetical protein
MVADRLLEIVCGQLDPLAIHILQEFVDGPKEKGCRLQALLSDRIQRPSLI